MKAWVDFLDNPETIRAIYPDNLPSLCSVDLHEITFHHDGPRISLRFDLSTYPMDPPKKWEARHFNAVQVQLDLFGVVQSMLNGWSIENTVDLELSRDSNIVRLKCSKGPLQIDIQGNNFFVQKVIGYRRGADSEQLLKIRK